MRINFGGDVPTTSGTALAIAAIVEGAVLALLSDGAKRRRVVNTVWLPLTVLPIAPIAVSTVTTGVVLIITNFLPFCMICVGGGVAAAAC